MLQDEDYDSDTSDEDFVPQGAESEDDVSGEDVEDNEDDGEDKPGKDNRKRKKKANPLMAQLGEEEEERGEEEAAGENDEATKKKDDNIWADFLADVEDKPSPPPKPRAKSWAALLGKKTTAPAQDKPTVKAPAAPSPKVAQPDAEPKPSTVKITKVFEFAGEEVRIEKEVAADSVEAKAASIAPEVSAANGRKGVLPSGGGSGSKRPAGLTGVLGLLDSKKQKLTTLEKTKLDWSSFKAQEGLDEELEHHKKSKDGYLEKQDFLQRSDLRQFEIEKAMRQGKRSNR